MKPRLIPLNLLVSLSVYPLSFLNPVFGAVDDRLVEGAKKEAELVIYSGMTVADATALLQAFEKKYPFIKGAAPSVKWGQANNPNPDRTAGKKTYLGCIMRRRG